MLLLIALLLGMAPALANEADAVEFAAVEDEAIQLKDDFAVKAILARKNARAPLESSFQFYADGSATYFSLAVRWMRASRLDFYLEKYVDGQYIGSLIAEEFDGAKKAGYVSTNDGWDASQETAVETVLMVRDHIATVTVTGNVSNVSKTLHFDLTKAPWLADKFTEKKPVLMTKGPLKYTIRGGSFEFIGVDAATLKGEKAMLPEDVWMKARIEARTAHTPFGDLNVGDYTARNYRYENISIPYQIYLPASYEEGKEYPVMLFLHGAGFKGSDNQQIITGSEFVLCRKMIEEGRECIVIAPQTPEHWVQYDTDRSGTVRRPRGLVTFSEAQESAYLKGVLAMIDEMKKTNFVDDSRVYVSGYSMGGHATWYLLAAYPDLFAAAIISCGSGSIEMADVIAKTPIYVFHGDLDDIVSHPAAQAVTEAVQEAGGEATFISAAGYDHGISVPMRMDNTVLDWLFSHSKEPKAVSEPAASPAAAAKEVQAEAEPIEYLPLENQPIQVQDDFSIRAVLQRKGGRSALDSSIHFYATESNTLYSLVVRWLKPDNCDIYLEKYVDAKYIGNMVAEEFKGIQKVKYNTSYYGWDLTSEKDLELVLTVQNGIACVDLKGAVTGMGESYHFDLSKSPVLNNKAVEKKPVQTSKGLLKYTVRGGSFTAFEIDADTLNGKKAALPENEWVKAKRENHRASTPLGSLNIGNFTAGKYIHNGTVLPYQIYLPENYEAGKKYPVMFFLHGRDMWGTDNEKPIASGDFTLCHKMIEEKRECIIIAPQSDYYWITYSPIRSGQPLTYPRRMLPYDDIQETVYMQATVALVNEVKKMDFIDETRMYVSGYSMGGHGTWYLLATYPDTFAAGVIFCGVGSIEKAADIAKTPIYVYHGTQDTLVSYADSKRLADAVQQAGGDVTYYTAEGYGHGLFVPIRMDNTVLDWLFSHTKAQPAQ